MVKEEDIAYGLRLVLSKKEQKRFMKIIKNQLDFFDFFARIDRSMKKNMKNRERYNRFRACCFFFLGTLFSANKMRFPTINNEDIKRTTEKKLNKIGQAIQRLEQEIEECDVKIRSKLKIILSRGVSWRDQIEEIDSLNPIFKVFTSSLLLGNDSLVRGSAVGTCYLLADIFLQKAESEDMENEEKRQIIAEAEEILRKKEA